jgi:hypothetical protein
MKQTKSSKRPKVAEDTSIEGTPSGESIHVVKMVSPFDLLNDDDATKVGEHVGKLCGPQAYIRLAQTGKRFQRLLLPGHTTSKDEKKRNVIDNVINARTKCIFRPDEPSLFPAPSDWTDEIHTLQQLALFELWYCNRFRRDNRICFDFANIQVQNEHWEIITEIQAIMDSFPAVTVRLDALCGTDAPAGIAVSFSQYRGNAVRNAICQNAERPYHDRVNVVPWGKAISRRVAASDHPFKDTARSGRGWVEVSFQLEGDKEGQMLLLPPQPSYYSMQLATSDDSSSDSENWDTDGQD